MLLDTYIAQVSLQQVLYCSTKTLSGLKDLIMIYSISTQNQVSELLWHYLLKEWCESDVDSEEL